MYVEFRKLTSNGIEFRKWGYNIGIGFATSAWTYTHYISINGLVVWLPYKYAEVFFERVIRDKRFADDLKLLLELTYGMSTYKKSGLVMDWYDKKYGWRRALKGVYFSLLTQPRIYAQMLYKNKVAILKKLVKLKKVEETNVWYQKIMKLQDRFLLEELLD